jgi:hypothetical protein
MFKATPETIADARRFKYDLISHMFGQPDDFDVDEFVAEVADAASAEPVRVRAAARATKRRRKRPSLISHIPHGGNIRGIGYGAKLTTGAGLDDVAVRVYVRAKQPKSSLTAGEIVPSEINGVPTDVVQVGEIHAASAVQCGVSVGHVKVTAGTIGCVVTLAGKGNKKFILSNNHVLANANDAVVGDKVIQPGSLDGGKLPAIAKLTDFEKLLFADGTANKMDAAIAELVKPNSVTPDLKVIGAMASPVTEPAVFQSVRKHGRTTLHTIGVIMDLAADIKVSYGGQVASFEDQLAVSGVNGVFADRGDSGALVVDAVTRRPVALLFAVTPTTTFCNPIDPILKRFGAEIAFTV